MARRSKPDEGILGVRRPVFWAAFCSCSRCACPMSPALGPGPVVDPVALAQEGETDVRWSQPGGVWPPEGHPARRVGLGPDLRRGLSRPPDVRRLVLEVSRQLHPVAEAGDRSRGLLASCTPRVRPRQSRWDHRSGRTSAGRWARSGTASTEARAERAPTDFPNRGTAHVESAQACWSDSGHQEAPRGAHRSARVRSRRRRPAVSRRQPVPPPPERRRVLDLSGVQRADGVRGRLERRVSVGFGSTSPTSSARTVRPRRRGGCRPRGAAASAGHHRLPLPACQSKATWPPRADRIAEAVGRRRRDAREQRCPELHRDLEGHEEADQLLRRCRAIGEHLARVCTLRARSGRSSVRTPWRWTDV